MRLKAKDRNTWNHLAWTIVIENLMHEICIPYRISRAWEIRGRSRHQNQSKRIVWNMEERNVGNISGKSPNQGLISAIDLSEGREFPPTTIRLANLTYSLI